MTTFTVTRSRPRSASTGSSARSARTGTRGATSASPTTSTYIEHVLGKHGREEVRAWIKPTMEDYGEIYTVYEWHMIGDDGRVVVYMQNRRDNPEPGAPPIDFPGITVLQYAGDGRSRSKKTSGRCPRAPRR